MMNTRIVSPLYVNSLCWPSQLVSLRFDPIQIADDKKCLSPNFHMCFVQQLVSNIVVFVAVFFVVLQNMKVNRGRGESDRSNLIK